MNSKIARALPPKLQVPDFSLAALEFQRPLIRGYLYKLAKRRSGTSTDSGDSGEKETWTIRLFVLMRDSRLFLFRATAAPTAQPVTYLPVSTSHFGFDTVRKLWTLELNGFGVAMGGGLQERSWTLSALSDANLLDPWVAALDTLEAIAREARSMSPPLTGGLNSPLGSIDEDLHYVPPEVQRSLSNPGDWAIAGIDMVRTVSAKSLNSGRSNSLPRNNTARKERAKVSWLGKMIAEEERAIQKAFV
ncbi:hypothetical protein HDU83_005340 [Entophlyctis luteolus]|nr:hypothetical protein HDU82_004616 [Entophlyctis luteolus]KAJ3354415.1 hypothetical protein HDU83_005340 [Entophlyctis luteolus]KAJ3389519.1 hypothetical protein HDU84_008630 [Entophlyctis sp. JEL0112]